MIGVSPYLHLENKELYDLIEFSLIKDNNKSDIFIMNQPYSIDEVSSIFSNNPFFTDYFKESNYFSMDSVSIQIKPAHNAVYKLKNTYFFPSLDLDGTIGINKTVFVNEIELDNKLKYETDYHGQTDKWFMGNFKSSYALLNLTKVDFFGGKVSRNMGTLNDYSLIFSDNPYSFHHYGFSSKNYRLNYSFYTSRLNDMYIHRDVNNDFVDEHYKRYWAFQKFDYKVSSTFQISLSESVIYGGSTQNIASQLINPTYFFYAAQVNDYIASNNFWSLQFVYLFKSKFGLYFDFFVDDIVVNNEKGRDDVSMHPNRLGFLFKISSSSDNNLHSLRYVRIWDETYKSLRLYENYISYSKSIGFPRNSYESLIYKYSIFEKLPYFLKTSLEVFRRGEKKLLSYFDINNMNPFPSKPLEKGIIFSIYASKINNKFILKNSLDIIYLRSELTKNNSLIFEGSVKISYKFNKSF